MYRSSKTYGHDIGLSCCFRQWRAESHCRFLHGYALCVHIEFAADTVDDNNWVVDFGALKTFKAWLQDTFDHKLIVAVDDPMRAELEELESKGLAQLTFVEATGCEAFARMVYDQAVDWLERQGYAPRVGVHHVSIREHGANSATYVEAVG